MSRIDSANTRPELLVLEKRLYRAERYVMSRLKRNVEHWVNIWISLINMQNLVWNKLSNLQH